MSNPLHCLSIHHPGGDNLGRGNFLEPALLLSSFNWLDLSRDSVNTWRHAIYDLRYKCTLL